MEENATDGNLYDSTDSFRFEYQLDIQDNAVEDASINESLIPSSGTGRLTSGKTNG
jgi:hypothetical protein